MAKDERCDDPGGPFFHLTDRVAIVTGAADGIGAAIAKRFSAAGGIVIGADIRDIAWAGAEQLAARKRCDMSIEADVRALMRHAAQEFGRLPVLVNNAGIYRPGTVRDMEAAGLLELADRHIRVNCISPGTIHAGLNDNEHGRAEMRAAAILQPLTRVGQPREVAARVHFLAPRPHHGQAIALDGGKSAGLSRASSTSSHRQPAWGGQSPMAIRTGSPGARPRSIL